MSPDLISIRDAQKVVVSRTKRVASERIAIDDALDRVLAAQVSAAGDVPPFASSAMDGYAIEAGPERRTLTIVGESRAGSPSDLRLASGQAIRISTGAAVPAGAGAVIPQENVSRQDSLIETLSSVREGQNIRALGEDLKAGALVLAAGTLLGAAELGAAVAAGAGTVEVAARPRVAVLCTGDELRAPGEPLGPGEIHNSNGPMLVALATRCGARVSPATRLADDRGATESGLREALDSSDLVVISGGVSVGPHDHVKPALQSLGVAAEFWGVSLQPGKPTWFGTRNRTLVFGLPGNPVSAAVTFTLFVAPALAAMQGREDRSAVPTRAVLGAEVRRNRLREQAIRVRLEPRDGADPIAIPNGPQGSHIISSLLGADGLALIAPGNDLVPAGTPVTVEPLLR